MGVISVSASGIIRAKRPGQATVKVFSAFDSINYDEVCLYSNFICLHFVAFYFFPV